MARYLRKTFRDQDGVAVRLPKAIAFPPDTPVKIEWEGDMITVRAIQNEEHSTGAAQ